MADSNVFNSNAPILESLTAFLATWPANHEGITPNRQPSPREPSSPMPATPPPSPLDAAMQAVQNRIDLEGQQEAQLQELFQLLQELAEKQQRVATFQHKLQAVSQSVRYCQHCTHPLYIHLPDGALEPCTRSNRLNCGYAPHKMGEKLLVGSLECIKKRNADKGRRKYAARKVREQAGNTASSPATPMADMTGEVHGNRHSKVYRVPGCKGYAGMRPLQRVARYSTGRLKSGNGHVVAL